MQANDIQAGNRYRVKTTKTLTPICRVIQGRREGVGEPWKFLVEIIDKESKRRGQLATVKANQFVEAVDE